jgi:hypothetical protein
MQIFAIDPLGVRVCAAQVCCGGKRTRRHLAERGECHVASVRQVHFWREGEGHRGGLFQICLRVLRPPMEVS